MSADACCVDGCERPVRVKSRQLCVPHYHRWQRHGDPLGGGPERLVTVEERLRQYEVDKNGCWNWTAGVDSTTGYGIAGSSSAHRASYGFYHGPIPPGMHVLHRCDNRRCVNPDHLWLGTNADNVADMVAKGRQCRGEARSHLLTEDDVRAIRGDSRSARVVAAEYGVAPMTIYSIRNGQNWKHVS